jgi:hypothetical protein
MVILTNNTNIGLTCILDEIGDSNTCSTSTTYSTRFKHADAINLTCWFSQIDVGTTMVPIENNLGYVSNIKSSSSSDIKMEIITN